MPAPAWGASATSSDPATAAPHRGAQGEVLFCWCSRGRARHRPVGLSLCHQQTVLVSCLAAPREGSRAEPELGFSPQLRTGLSCAASARSLLQSSSPRPELSAVVPARFSIPAGSMVPASVAFPCQKLNQSLGLPLLPQLHGNLTQLCGSCPRSSSAGPCPGDPARCPGPCGWLGSKGREVLVVTRSGADAAQAVAPIGSSLREAGDHPGAHQGQGQRRPHL